MSGTHHEERTLETSKGELGAFIERLASRLGASASTQLVFAEPIERDGVTVIPVARTRYGFGGGAGVGRGGKTAPRTDEGFGFGGGGGVNTNPIGYIAVSEGTVRYVPFPDPVADASRYAIMAVAGGVGAWLVFRGLRSVVRALHR